MSDHLWYEGELGKTICVGAALPDGYRRYTQSEAYIRRECTAKKHYQFVGRPGAYGARWRYGPVAFEKYVADEEPYIERRGWPRKIIWQRICSNEQPSGWKLSETWTVPRLTGFVELDSGDMTRTWSAHARRHLKTFHAASTWRLEPVTYAEFLHSYRKTDKPYFIKRLFTHVLREKIQAHGVHVRLFGARLDRPGAPLEAGLGVFDVPEIGQSVHLLSFIHPRAKMDSVGFGLMERWFLESLNKSMKFLDFDTFWAPKDPVMWRGFSAFKSQFGTRFILHPPALTRWSF
ncbi:hypothetical protein HYW18_02875 [Candidatus Uhrbacteria bacterium]|nr:hypothetical protein [Candidatus Uhrbacteria bacterium]